MTLYDRALKLMFLLPPERIHGIISGALQTLHLATPVNRVMEKAVRVHDPVLRQTVFGVDFPPRWGWRPALTRTPRRSTPGARSASATLRWAP